MEKFSENSAPMVGAWELISFKIQKANGEVIHPFGRNARGYSIYTDSGRFSAQVVSPDRPKFASGDQMKGTLRKSKQIMKGAHHITDLTNLTTKKVSSSIM